MPTPRQETVVAPDAPNRSRAGTPRSRLVLATAAVAVLPVLVAVVSLVGYKWFPASDLAVEVLGIRDVGGRHTPLVGVQSRFGYFHPGPLLFWVLAPFEWVLGTTGILIGTGLLNGASIVGAVFVAGRRGGAPVVVGTGLAAVLVCRGMGLELLIEPWNPWLVVMPFLLYALLAWSVADRDWPTLPWAVGVGSFIVQVHVGFAPLVLGLGAVVGVLAVVGVRRVQPRDPPGPPAGRWLAIAGVVGVVLWLPPVVQQLTGSPGNLGELVDAFRHPAGPQTGWSDAFGIMGRQLSPIPPFVAGTETTSLDTLARSSTIPALALLATCAGLGFLAWRRGARSAGRLSLLAVAGAVCGVIATSRIIGLQAPYLVRWAWIVAALVWLSILWSVWQLVPHGRVARAAVVGVFAVTAVVSIVTAVQAVGTRPPLDEISAAIGALGAQIEDALDEDRRYQVGWVDIRNFGSAGIGVAAELEDRGYDVRVKKSYSHAFGSWRTARASEVDGVITVVAASDLTEGFEPPAGARLVASFDPLSPRERARFRRLERLARDQAADEDDLKELEALAARGDRYRAYVEP